jgi:protein-S-isoprenylcysteine O-methyltransferase Ste14
MQPELAQAGVTARVGAWLFRHRTAAPLPIALAVVMIPPDESAPGWLTVIGIALISAGELLRLWSVRHIGTISRTRSGRLGPLIDSGPFAVVRNPLYIGNLALWTGFASAARLVWLAPVAILLLGAEYHAIVRWEEGLLESRYGDEYRDYAARVPRWSGWRSATRSDNRDSVSPSYSWGETLFSERGTLAAIAGGFLLLWLKLR